VKLTTTKDFQSRHYSFRSTRKARTATSPDAGPAGGGRDETVREILIKFFHIKVLPMCLRF
jgi:hypothetical protein